MTMLSRRSLLRASFGSWPGGDLRSCKIFGASVARDSRIRAAKPRLSAMASAV
jgi:hypothetical protein